MAVPEERGQRRARALVVEPGFQTRVSWLLFPSAPEKAQAGETQSGVEAGSSVGSVLGAAYASGAPLERIIEACRTLRFRHIARWRVSRLGLASNQRLGELIERAFGSRQFEDLRIPLAVVATDLSSGEPVVFTQGNLVDAIRASCAFPGLFEPVEIGTRCLADGGLVAPLPTQAARSMGRKR